MGGRGKVVLLNLPKEITFNECVYSKARVEIDYLNLLRKMFVSFCLKRF
jgi:hypothetical protein